MSERSAAVPAPFRPDTDGIGGRYPFRRGHRERVRARLSFEGLDFDALEIGVVQRFSNTEEFEGVPIAHPVLDHHLRLIALVTRDVGQADAIVGCSRRSNGYLDP